jgi:lysine/ornithine N-monooxygenase/predicted FMN-binding regulatory protein PaiB
MKVVHPGSESPGGEPLDCLAFGLGPSNLALAVAARESDPARRMLFLEQKPCFQWHPGMLLEGARMQISFLKDLVTLRNPASPFTFLQYVKSKGRIERFINLRDFHPTRREYHDYLEWVARAFDDQVRYGTAVRKVVPECTGDGAPPSLLRVHVENLSTGVASVLRARNVVYACGGTPYLPPGCDKPGPRLLHSSDFLSRIPRALPDRAAPCEVAVVGNGQSAGEIVAHILAQYPGARVHLFLSGFALHAADSSPFINEAFFSQQADEVFAASKPQRKALLDELRGTNYGVTDTDLIDTLYRQAYSDEVRGQQRLVLHRFSELVSARDLGPRAELVSRQCDGDSAVQLAYDCIVMATGYRRQIDTEVFEDVLPLICRTEDGSLQLTRQYRVETVDSMAFGLYVQGYGEESHGIGDTLLSLLPFRSHEIFSDICRNTPPARSRPVQVPGVYPPQRHLETDSRKLYSVLQEFKFATLVSSGEDGPLVTHVPLTLDRERGRKGVLFGHMDRANPHVNLLDGQRVLAVFHGPNTYISPHTYQTSQLPTWNSIAVHVRGVVRLIDDNDALVRGLATICEQSDRAPGAYRLDPQDPRIGRLIDYIIGFEIEIDEMVGRFKLSQDRSDSDSRLAADEFLRHTVPSQRAVVQALLGLDDDPVVADKAIPTRSEAATAMPK